MTVSRQIDLLMVHRDASEPHVHSVTQEYIDQFVVERGLRGRNFTPFQFAPYLVVIAQAVNNQLASRT